MKKNKEKARIQLEFRRSHPALIAAVTVLIVFAAAALTALGCVHRAIRTQTENLRDQISAVEYANDQLKSIIDAPDSRENVQKIAEKELDLVDPDTVIINTEG